MSTLVAKHIDHLSPIGVKCPHEHYDMTDPEDTLRYLTCLHKNGAIKDEDFNALMHIALSIFVSKMIEQSLETKIGEVLKERLSPKNILDVLA